MIKHVLAELTLVFSFLVKLQVSLFLFFTIFVSREWIICHCLMVLIMKYLYHGLPIADGNSLPMNSKSISYALGKLAGTCKLYIFNYYLVKGYLITGLFQSFRPLIALDDFTRSLHFLNLKQHYRPNYWTIQLLEIVQWSDFLASQVNERVLKLVFVVWQSTYCISSQKLSMPFPLYT